MAQLTAFNYLRASRPLLLQRLMTLRIPAPLRPASFALGAALVIVSAALGIERSRLLEAQQEEAVYRRHFQTAERAVERANLYAERITALRALDKRVQSIELSGDSAAGSLADIANHLPPDAWLTSISHQGTGIALEGEAKSMRAVGEVVSAFAHGGTLRDPLLTAAAAVSETPGERRMKYALTAEARP